MERESLWAKALEEDRRFTEYRLEVASELPAGSFRDAVIAGIAARLEELARLCEDRTPATRPNWNGRH